MFTSFGSVSFLVEDSVVLTNFLLFEDLLLIFSNKMYKYIYFFILLKSRRFYFGFNDLKTIVKLRSFVIRNMEIAIIEGLCGMQFDFNNSYAILPCRPPFDALII